MRTVLICDDDEGIQRALSDELARAGWVVHCVDDGAAALQAIAEGLPDAVVLDVHMPHVDGLDVLRRVRALDGGLPVVVITGDPDRDNEAAARALGASDFLHKPFAVPALAAALAAATDATGAPGATRAVGGAGAVDDHGGAAPPEPPDHYGELLGRSPGMRAVFDTLERVERVAVPMVLLVGESGTGKELVAQAIHARGPRRAGPYVEIDCASVPEMLIESELFGHEKGSFTDAQRLKRGLFEVAARGTIFLDEIGEMALGMQAKLLRALEGRRFKRVGGVTPLALDAGIVAATNRDLRAEVKAGRFREDLYFRLNVLPIVMPPLRGRRDDIELIAAHLVKKLGAQLGRHVPGVTAAALRVLRAYAWPGNVRELRNVIECAIILKATDGPIDVDDLPWEVRAPQPSDLRAAFPLPPEGVVLADVERTLVEQALERAGGVRTHAARLLGISRFALRYRLEKFGLLGTAGAAPPADGDAVGADGDADGADDADDADEDARARAEALRHGDARDR